MLALRRTMRHGEIRSVSEWVEIMEHVEKELDSFEDHPVLMTMARFNPRKEMDKVAKEMFERFNVPGLYISAPSVLSLYSTGRTTGLVIGSGDGITHCDPIVEGIPLPDAFRVNIAGRECTAMLQHLLRESGVALGKSSAEFELVRELKEKHAYFALDYERSLRDAYRGPKKFEKTFALPDGQLITTGDPLFRCMEGIFQPAYLGFEAAGIHQTAFGCIMEAPRDVRRDLLGNVLVSGGTTLAPGFEERLRKELRILLDENGFAGVKLNTHAPPERAYSVWIGGSILTSLSTFDAQWVKREDVAEVGLENAVHLFTKTLSSMKQKKESPASSS